MPAIPGLIATIGLHGSASTWVFNVVRELLIAALGEDQVLALYADRLSELPAETDRPGCLLLKSHHGSAELDAWLATARPVVFLSLRDPRDAAISMAQRFRAPLGQAAHWLADDCARLLRLAGQGHPLLRYEDRFFDDRAVPEQLARTLGLTLEPAAIEAIFARYSTTAVRRFTQRLADLPPERLVVSGALMFDRVTQIHRVHIGDARTGKWRDLPGPAQAELTRFFRPFLERFGYPG